MTKQQAAPAPVYCFVDTNVLLHHQLFNEVDWPRVVGAPQVCLVLAPMVTRELDKFKDDNSQPWRKKRARTVLGKIEEFLPDPGVGTSATVRPNVTIFEVTSEPVVDWQSLALDPGIPDDRLIASIIHFKAERPDADIRLISGDRGPRRTANRHRIPATNPKGKIAELEPSSEDSKKIADLQRQLQQALIRAPRLDLGIWDGGASVSQIILPYRPLGDHVRRPRRSSDDGADLTDEQIEAVVADEREKIKEVLGRAPAKCSEKDIRAYEKAAEEYISALPLYLKMRRTCELGQRCVLQFVLSNVGSIEAMDIRVEPRFPEGAFVFDPTEEDHDDVELTARTEPVAEWMRPKDPWGMTGLYSRTLLFPRSAAVPRPPMREGPLYDTCGDRSLVVYKDPKLFAGTKWILPSVVAYFPPDAGGRAAMRYAILANGLASPVRGQIEVVWRPPEEM